MNRHDFSNTDRQLFNTAVRLDITDAVGLGCLITEHGTNAAAILADLDECAGALQHETGERGRARRIWFGAREAIAWFAADKADQERNPDAPDKFGFRAQARDRSARDLAAAGITL